MRLSSVSYNSLRTLVRFLSSISVCYRLALADIERTYGQRKILAQRIPLMPRHKKSESVDEQLLSSASSTRNRGHAPTGSVSSISSFASDQADLPTPAPTEGDTGTETEFETERETDLDTDVAPHSQQTRLPIEQQFRNLVPDGNFAVTPASQHDLMNRYFRKDALFISNIDLLRWDIHTSGARKLITHSLSRTSDLQLVLLISYVLIFTLSPRELSNRAVLTFHFIHALGWCLFHSFGLGVLLQGQSKNKMLVRHFLKHYPYPQRSELGKSPSLAKAAATEAFENWKRLYNLSLCMSYGTLPCPHSVFSSRADAEIIQFRFWVLFGRRILFLAIGLLELSY